MFHLQRIIKKLFFKYMFFIYSFAFAQDANKNNNFNDEYLYNFESISEFTVYGKHPLDFAPKSIEANVLSVLNGSSSNRRQFIENVLLENAGFRRTGNVRFRSTDATEKSLSVLHEITHLLSLGIIPRKPFFEIEYGRLPRGAFYPFQAIIDSSELNNISPVVIAIMEIEYMLQIEFSDGYLIKNWNANYYTEENINKFERLIMELPEFPENIQLFRERYLKIELPKIKRALERHNNPSENYLRAIENLNDIFIKN